MLQTLELIIIGLAIVATGGGLIHPKTQDYLQKHPLVRRSATLMGIIAGLYFVAGLFVDVKSSALWLYQRITVGRYLNRDYSLAECDKHLGIDCVRYGGSYGEAGALSAIRSCPNLTLLSSSQPSLNWTSLWITNIYSFAPGGGGPGGGLLNEVLKVGGRGDWYFTLIKFDLPARYEPMSFAGVLLFAQDGEHETIPLFVDRIIEPWKWDLTQHIWWKDRPGGFPIVTEALPAPQKTHWYVVEVTRLVNQWSAGAIGNFGFQIRPASNYGSFVEFANNLATDKTKIPHLLLCPKN
jgi:hypothetical protein